jgi:hypothetical protein
VDASLRRAEAAYYLARYHDPSSGGCEVFPKVAAKCSDILVPFTVTFMCLATGADTTSNCMGLVRRTRCTAGPTTINT